MTTPGGEHPVEFYVDQFRITGTAYGVAITFGLNPPHPAPGQAAHAQDLTPLRMSLEHAKVMSMVLRRYLKGWERESGVTINLPSQLLTQLGLPLEDW